MTAHRPYIPPIVIIHDDRGTNDYLINIYMADMMSFILNLYLILENALKRQIRRSFYQILFLIIIPFYSQ